MYHYYQYSTSRERLLLLLLGIIVLMSVAFPYIFGGGSYSAGGNGTGMFAFNRVDIEKELAGVKDPFGLALWVSSHLDFSMRNMSNSPDPRRLLVQIRKYGRTAGVCEHQASLFSYLFIVKKFGYPIRLKVKTPDGVHSEVFWLSKNPKNPINSIFHSFIARGDATEILDMDRGPIVTPGLSDPINDYAAKIISVTKVIPYEQETLGEYIDRVNGMKVMVDGKSMPPILTKTSKIKLPFIAEGGTCEYSVPKQYVCPALTGKQGYIVEVKPPPSGICTITGTNGEKIYVLSAPPS